MRPITTVCGPTGTAAAASIAASQTLTAAGPLTLTSAPFTVSPAAQVTISSAGNDSALYWTITGIASNGQTMSEQLHGGNAVLVTSQFVYRQVNSIVANGPTASTVTAGVSAYTVSPMVRLDEWADAPVGVQVAILSGSPTFTVQHSFDDPNDLVNPVPAASMFWDSGLVVAGAVNATAGLSFAMATAPLYMRLIITLGSGSAKMVVTQYNVVEA